MSAPTDAPDDPGEIEDSGGGHLNTRLVYTSVAALLLGATIVCLVGGALAGPHAGQRRAASTGTRAAARATRQGPQPAPGELIPASVSVESGSGGLAVAPGDRPVRLIISRMRLDAPILALAPDANGGMRAPQPHGLSDPILNEVYWWDVGAVPGQPGNAAIAGHVNRPDGSSATFGNLNVLRPGDQIEVVTAGGALLTFVVTTKDTPLVYVHGGNDPTVQRIFGPSLTPNLNLLTCWGTWDGTTYNRRLVVYSTLVRVTRPGARASGAGPG